MNPTLYALVVGINDYREDLLLTDKVRFPQLRGCVNDALSIKGLLERDKAFDCKIKVLLDKDATKKAIVQAFTQHLGKATENDVVLFYYSGHGTQEWCDVAAFASETDGKHESIACYYDEQTIDNFLLADKELRFLIYQLSLNNPHIVTIFDCCHAAGNTRNAGLATKAFNQVIEKRIPYVFPQRTWDKYIFSPTMSSNDFSEKGEPVMLPEGLHIQLAACESNESALEVSGRGVFTEAIIKILESSSGEISYHALRNRARQYMRHIYDQKPRIYVPGKNEMLLFTCFLNKPVHLNKTSFAEVTFNTSVGWQMNLGAIHGMGKHNDAITIIDPDNPGISWQSTIVKVKTDASELAIQSTGKEPNPEKVYKAYIDGLLSRILPVHIAPNNAIPEEQLKVMDMLLSITDRFITLKDDEKEAKYVLRYLNGRYHITRPEDPYRPLIQPVDSQDVMAATKLATCFKHLSQWEYFRHLKNEDDSTLLSNDALKIEIKQLAKAGDVTGVAINEELVPLHFEQDADKWKTFIRIAITNTTDSNLYCGVLYLTSRFQVFNGFLNPTTYMLEPGNTVELQLNNNALLPVIADEVLFWYNHERLTDYLKFIVSTEEFDIESFSLSSLPPPPMPNGNRSQKSIVLDGDYENVAAGWYTKDLELELLNPTFNVISEERLEQMLVNPDTADFALGLYFDAEMTGLEPCYTLKKQIKLKKETGTAYRKGFVQDTVLNIANAWARRRRNRYFDQVIKKYPDRLKIVAEGDSWFQHPLVLDTIDHLSRVYAVYCVSAAGDTLRNYLSNEKNNGEYFLDAIKRNSPAIFVISGGGNDVLGAQFRNYLVIPTNSAPPGTDPKRFLKSDLFDELKTLQEIYRTIFDLLKSRNIPILIHGYDYPVKLNDARKGWLGRYMIEKGISDPQDRLAVVRLIVDAFNDSLQTVSKEFSNVYYIDVRGTIRYNEAEGVDQWYDEIHPNNDGFQQVAMKFMKVINTLFP